MVKKPIRVSPKPYRGNDSRKRKQYQEALQAARAIQDYINTRMKDSEQGIFTYDEIAEELYIDVKLVAELLMYSGGGNTGITVFNPEFKAK